MRINLTSPDVPLLAAKSCGMHPAPDTRDRANNKKSPRNPPVLSTGQEEVPGELGGHQGHVSIPHRELLGWGQHRAPSQGWLRDISRAAPQTREPPRPRQTGVALDTLLPEGTISC